MADDSPVVILGAGLTGLSAALHFAAQNAGRRVLVLERAQRPGGKARSRRERGYTFDVTGHWLHLRDPRVEALVDRLFDPGDLVEIERRTGIYTHGTMLRYPFQANLHGLPLEVVQECLVGFIEAQRTAAGPDATEPRTFEDFAVARFGRGIAKHFFVPYNAKLWGTEFGRLTPDWVSRFVPIPNVDQVVGGAIGLPQEGLGYNARFRYPKAGGIDHLPNAFARALESHDNVEVRLGADVVSVDAERRVVRFADGAEQRYASLVSTTPLPSLIGMLTQTPDAVTDASASLRHIGWRYLDVATSTPTPMREHWVYVPEPDVPFFRVGCYSNALPAMAPPGCSSLYVELADRGGPPDLPVILRGLAEMGAITDPEDVVFANVRDIDCAYVVFDEAYPTAIQTLHRHLEGVGIRSCGRYGAWIYNSMEDSIIAGIEAAQWLSE